MITIKEVRLRRFCQYSSFTAQLSPGLTRVSGPNGSGKSNFFRGIIYALTGWCDPSWGSQTELQKEGESVPGYAELDFELEDELYTVRRYTATSAKSADTLMQGSTLVTEKRQRVNQWLEDKLSIPLTVLAQLMWLRQEEAAWLLTSPAAVINAFLGTIFDTKKLEKLREHLKKSADTIATLRSDFDEREAIAKASLEKAGRCSELEAELATAQEALQKLEVQYSSVDRAVDRATWEATLATHEKGIRTLKHKKDCLEVDIEYVSDEVKSFKASSIDEVYAEIKTAQDTYFSLFGKRKELENKIAELQVCQHKLRGLQDSNATEKCEFCGSILADVEQYRDNIASSICGKHGKYEELVQSTDDLIVQYNGDIEALNNHMHEACDKELGLDKKIDALKRIAGQYEQWQKDVQELAQVEILLKNREQVLEAHKQIPISDVDKVALKDALEVQRKVVEVIKNEYEPLVLEIKLAEASIVECAKDRAAYQLNTFVKGILTTLRDCLSQSRAQAKYISGKIDAFNTYIDYYLSLSAMPFRLQLDPVEHVFKYTMSDGTEEHSAGKLSGAQKAAASIAVQMALVRTAIPDLTLLLVDEADAALSTENKHIAAELYRTLAACVQGVSGSVLVISQSDEVSDDCEHLIEVST